ncbi:Transaldolase [Musa troglodytarum]|uniref:Transaldolase n=1 Tax=Musa troglodytarum TaxID=320322 RepID=A0A9E7JE11_9LILI|nr:Transaldolase [Musa troglodytarum]
MKQTGLSLASHLLHVYFVLRHVAVDHLVTLLLLPRYRIRHEQAKLQSFPQAAAAAQAGASVIQIFVGRIRDWSRNHTGDPELDAICRKGEDPGLELLVNWDEASFSSAMGPASKELLAAVLEGYANQACRGALWENMATSQCLVIL